MSADLYREVCHGIARIGEKIIIIWRKGDSAAAALLVQYALKPLHTNHYDNTDIDKLLRTELRRARRGRLQGDEGARRHPGHPRGDGVRLRLLAAEHTENRRKGA